MISYKSKFRSKSLKMDILQHVSEAITNYYDQKWWLYNEAALIRKLEYIVSKKSSRKIIDQAKRYDCFYLEQIAYELTKQLRTF